MSQEDTRLTYPYMLTVDIVEQLKKRLKKADTLYDYQYFQRTLEFVAAEVAKQT